MMSYTALFWLVLHIAYGGAPALAAVDAAQCLPMLLFSRRAGIIVARHRAARVAVVTQALQATGALAIGIPLLAGWMTIWYLVPLSFAIGCVQCVDLPGPPDVHARPDRPAELRRGSSLYAMVTGLARIAGPGVAGIVIAATGETAVFFVDAASFLGVIAVLAWLSGTGGTRPEPAPGPATRPPPALAGRPSRRCPGRGRDGAAVGGFGHQFAVTNPLMASRVFHLGAVGFGLFGTCMAVGGIAGNYYSSRRGIPARASSWAGRWCSARRSAWPRSCRRPGPTTRPWS